jgi:hypothetical protein
MTTSGRPTPRRCQRYRIRASARYGHSAVGRRRAPSRSPRGRESARLNRAARASQGPRGAQAMRSKGCRRARRKPHIASPCPSAPERATTRSNRTGVDDPVQTSTASAPAKRRGAARSRRAKAVPGPVCKANRCSARRFPAGRARSTRPLPLVAPVPHGRGAAIGASADIGIARRCIRLAGETKPRRSCDDPDALRGPPGRRPVDGGCGRTGRV